MSTKNNKARKRNFHLFVLSGMVKQIEFIRRECKKDFVSDALGRLRLNIVEVEALIRQDKRSDYVKDSKNIRS